MLLETLDIKKNDIIIYSKNLFDVQKNFRIIDKDDESHTPRPISFDAVCRHIEDFAPKNLIVYRLLTNLRNFELQDWKYGVTIYINGEVELVYLDPVFAIKELEEYALIRHDRGLRFRIQQIGLTTLNRIEGKANFAEIYSIDMEAKEARYQSDKVFVEALYAAEPAESRRVKGEMQKRLTEDKEYDTDNLKGIMPGGNPAPVKGDYKTPDRSKLTFGEFIAKKKEDINKTDKDKKVVLKFR